MVFSDLQKRSIYPKKFFACNLLFFNGVKIIFTKMKNLTIEFRKVVVLLSGRKQTTSERQANNTYIYK